jgi:hypothetical protein
MVTVIRVLFANTNDGLLPKAVIQLNSNMAAFGQKRTFGHKTTSIQPGSNFQAPQPTDSNRRRYPQPSIQTGTRPGKNRLNLHRRGHHDSAHDSCTSWPT